MLTVSRVGASRQTNVCSNELVRDIHDSTASSGTDTQLAPHSRGLCAVPYTRMLYAIVSHHTLKIVFNFLASPLDKYFEQVLF
jgi:hypothetical protein